MKRSATLKGDSYTTFVPVPTTHECYILPQLPCALSVMFLPGTVLTKIWNDVRFPGRALIGGALSRISLMIDVTAGSCSVVNTYCRKGGARPLLVVLVV